MPLVSLRRAACLTAASLLAPPPAAARAQAAPAARQPAAEATLTGRVTDAATGRPLAGAQVTVVGTALGARTEADGTFRVARVPAGDQRLRVSMIGFAPDERVVAVAGAAVTVDVAMQAIAARLEGMVVVGYGTQNAATLTGAVSAVKGAELEAIPTPNLSNTLGGKLPGVMTVNTSGEPGGGGSTIRVRGSHTLNDNSALVVIDGVPDRAGGLERIDPRDIESISVLKDASAAIYGSRAANGVILVTTKRGAAGVSELSANVTYGVSQPTRLPAMADAATYMAMLNEIDVARGVAPRYTADQVSKFRAGGDAWLYPNTDWFAATIKDASPQTRASVSLRGGADRLKYFLSLGGQGEDGYYRNSATNYDQYSFRSNIDGRATGALNVRLDLNGRLEDRSYPNRSASDIFRSIMRGKPNMPAYWLNGMPGPDIEYGDNPVVIGTPATGYDRDQRYYLQGTLGLDLAVPQVKGLTVRGSAAYDQLFRYRKQWRTPWTLYTWDFATRDAAGAPVLQPGSRGYSAPELNQADERNNGVLLNLVSEYRREIGGHSLSALGGVERQTVDYSSLTAFRKNFVSGEIDQLFAGADGEKNNGGSAGLARRQNYFARLNYAFGDRYLLELVGRYDGSYIFAADRRFGFFPAVSAGWRISEESFFKRGAPFVNDLKLRGSLGRTGNDRIPEWQYLSTYGYGSGYVFGTTEVNSIYPTRAPNPDVTWEVANQLDLGLDAAVLNRRLTLTLDYFDERRHDILWQRNASVPQSAGLTLPRENIGRVDSRGVDGSMGWRQSLGGTRTLDVTLNAGYARNRIRFWDETPGAPAWQRSTGSAMSTSLYYKAIGVFVDSAAVAAYPHWSGARPGDLRFEDVNGDGAITAEDRVRINKTGDPTLTGGLTLATRVGAFEANVFFQGAAGAVQYLATESGDGGNYLAEYAEARWTPERPSATTPRAFNGGEYWRANANTYFLRDADYVRLKSLELGYRLPASLTSRLGVRQGRVYVSGFNLLTWDSMRLMDPEGRSSSGQYYPQSRVFTAGTSFSF